MMRLRLGSAMAPMMTTTARPSGPPVSICSRKLMNSILSWFSSSSTSRKCFNERAIWSVYSRRISSRAERPSGGDRGAGSSGCWVDRRDPHIKYGALHLLRPFDFLELRSTYCWIKLQQHVGHAAAAARRRHREPLRASCDRHQAQRAEQGCKARV